jgi:hypothetical protein
MAIVHEAKADLIGSGRLVAHAVVIHAVSSELVGGGAMALVPAEILSANDNAWGRLALLQLLVPLVCQDCHAVGYYSSDGGKYAYGKPIHETLSDDYLRQHLAGKRVVAVYPIAAGSSETSTGIFDIDNHAGVVSWDAVAKVALRITAAAKQRGLYVSAMRNGDGHGIHLWIRWEKPQRAAEVREFMAKILKNAGLADGADGIEIEIFPAQDDVPAGGYGNLIALPYARRSVPLNREMQPIDKPLLWYSSTPVPWGYEGIDVRPAAVQSSTGHEPAVTKVGDEAYEPGGDNAEPHRQYRPTLFLQASPEVIAAAESYIDKGNAITAVWLDGKAKRPWGDWNKGGKGWRARLTKDQILYSLNNGCQGIGWPGGEINHYVTALDFDTGIGDDWWCEQCRANGIDPEDFPTVITPGKIKPDGSRRPGKHRYVTDVRGTLGNNEGALTTLGINVRGKGFVVLPPSPHPDGGTYEWVPRHTLDDFPEGVTPCPDFVYEAIEVGHHKSLDQQSGTRGNGQEGDASANPDDRVYAYCRAVLNNLRQELAKEQSGNRNAALNIAALKLGSFAHYAAYSEDEARATLRAACASNGYMSEHTGESFDATFNSGWRKGIAEPKEIVPEPPRPKLNDDESPWPDPLAEAAYHGPAGEFVRVVEPQSEADPAALLISFLVAAAT